MTENASCFVAEHLKNGNATRAYVRAGYAPRGAQPSAQRRLRDRRIGAALAAGRLRIDREKASLARQAGVLALRITDHSNTQQRVTQKPGKLQAPAALTKQLGVLVQKPAPGLMAKDRRRYEDRCTVYERALDHSEEENRRLQRQLDDPRAAPAAAQAAGDDRFVTPLEEALGYWREAPHVEPEFDAFHYSRGSREPDEGGGGLDARGVTGDDDRRREPQTIDFP